MAVSFLLFRTAIDTGGGAAWWPLADYVLKRHQILYRKKKRALVSSWSRLVGATLVCTVLNEIADPSLTQKINELSLLVTCRMKRGVAVYPKSSLEEDRCCSWQTLHTGRSVSHGLVDAAAAAYGPPGNNSQPTVSTHSHLSSDQTCGDVRNFDRERTLRMFRRAIAMSRVLPSEMLVKSAEDPRSYRVLWLGNRLRCILVSDASCDKVTLFHTFLTSDCAHFSHEPFL